jgi:large subunit ribosomal protein L10
MYMDPSTVCHRLFSGGVRMGVREEKQQTVADIASKLRDSKSTVLVNYRGLDVGQVTELRKQLRESGVEFKVYKNTLARRATQETEMTELDQHLVGPTAIAFSTEDVIAPAKILAQFAKGNEALEIKAGIVEGRVVDVSEIKALADLPSRDGLLSMLLSVLQAPMRDFALATKAVADQKAEQA